MSEKDLEKILEKGHVKINHKTPIQIANVEPAPGSQPVEKKGHPGFTAPTVIHVHSVRKRLTDADGLSFKAVLDGIVHAGILTDDSPKYVKQIWFSQEKGRPEETIITIEEIDRDDRT